MASRLRSVDAKCDPALMSRTKLQRKKKAQTVEVYKKKVILFKIIHKELLNTGQPE